MSSPGSDTTAGHRSLQAPQSSGQSPSARTRQGGRLPRAAHRQTTDRMTEVGCSCTLCSIAVSAVGASALGCDRERNGFERRSGDRSLFFDEPSGSEHDPTSRMGGRSSVLRKSCQVKFGGFTTGMDHSTTTRSRPRTEISRMPSSISGRLRVSMMRVQARRTTAFVQS